MKSSRNRILVIGSSNMDHITEVDHMPAAGETILAGARTSIPGGKGANQAYALGRLGGRVTFLGAVGNDKDGKAMKDNLASVGVDVSHMIVSEDTPSGSTVLLVDSNGDNSIIVMQDANLLVTPDYLRSSASLFAESAVVMAQMEIPYDTVFAAMREGRNNGCITVLDPAPAPSSLPDEVLGCLDYLTPNETELMHLTGITSSSPEAMAEAAKRFLDKGTANVLITMGSRGVLLVNASGSRLFPAEQVHAVDSTAAGDTFNAAFIIAIMEGKDQAEAIAFAQKASAITVCRKGGQSSIPTRKEVEGL